MRELGTRAPIPKKPGLNNPLKQEGLKVIREINEAKPEVSNFLESRTVNNPGDSISTFSKKKEVASAPPAKKAIFKAKTIKLKSEEPYQVDLIKYNTLQVVYQSALPHFEAMIRAYKTLNLAPISLDILSQLYGGDLKQIEDRYYKDIYSDFDKLQLASGLIKENMLQVAGVPWQEFLSVIHYERTFLQRSLGHYTNRPEISFSFYSLNGSDLCFSEADQERLKESCSSYVDTTAKKDFLKLVDRFIETHGELKAILKRNNINRCFGYQTAFTLTTGRAPDEILFNKSVINSIKS